MQLKQNKPIAKKLIIFRLNVFEGYLRFELERCRHA